MSRILIFFFPFFVWASDYVSEYEGASFTKKTILVTGGAGYIGSHVSYLLAKLGHDVIILNHDSVPLIDCESWPAQLICCDISDKELLRKLFSSRNVDLVIHLAAFANLTASIANPRECYRQNLAASLVLLDAMAEFGVDKIIFSSSCSVYGPNSALKLSEDEPKNAQNPYGKSKYFLESVIADYAKAYGWKAVCFRYFNPAGALAAPGFSCGAGFGRNFVTRLVSHALKGETVSVFGADFPTKDGTCVRDYIHVWDIARAHAAAIDLLDTEMGCETFNLGAGLGYSILETIQTAEEVLQMPISYQFLPRKESDLPAVIAAIAKAETILHWSPRYSDLTNLISSTQAYLQKRQ